MSSSTQPLTATATQKTGNGLSPSVKLNSGHEMPVLGLGTFLAKPGEVGAAVSKALNAGYRHFDLAAVYGNEAEIGVALQDAIRGGVVTRGELFLTSKLAASQMEPAQAKACLAKTLADLQTDYLDLYLIHHAVPVSKDAAGAITLERKKGYSLQDIWRVLEGAVKAGQVRSIGVSNYMVQTLNDLLNYAEIPPAVNQIERHPYLVQVGMMELCQRDNIFVTAYAPLGAPALRDKRDHGFGVTPLLDSEVIAAIATKHKKTPGQVLIRWQLDTGAIAIPKSANDTRIVQNIDVFDFALDADDLAAIAKLSTTNLRYFSHGWTTIKPME
jgi:diketogulonate reductase-like aldo/keto reductase